MDIVIAALLACLSLYCGLLLSENQLSFTEVFFILIGRSVSGETVELGPYFWAMHTTFIPTIIYLTLIMVGWIGKTMLAPVRWFFGKGQEHKNPLALTAALFTLLATVFVLTGIATDGLEKQIDQNQKEHSIELQ